MRMHASTNDRIDEELVGMVACNGIVNSTVLTKSSQANRKRLVQICQAARLGAGVPRIGAPPSEFVFVALDSRGLGVESSLKRRDHFARSTQAFTLVRRAGRGIIDEYDDPTR